MLSFCSKTTKIALIYKFETVGFSIFFMETGPVEFDLKSPVHTPYILYISSLYFLEVYT